MSEPDDRLIDTVRIGLKLVGETALERFRFASNVFHLGLKIPLDLQVRLLELGVSYDAAKVIPEIFDEHWKPFEAEAGELDRKLMQFVAEVFWYGYVLGLRRAGKEDLVQEHGLAARAATLLEADEIRRKAESDGPEPPAT